VRLRTRVLRPLLAICALVLAGTGSAAAAEPIETFRTPSGNIRCAFVADPGYVRCEIGTLLKPQPRRPAWCELDWAYGLDLGRRGKGRVLCAGDTVFDPRARVLRYGSAFRRGGFRCLSRTDGLRCTSPSGHGFFLSRDRWRVF
jgi:hypothetical protein